MGIVLPNAILGAPGLDYACIRVWLLQKCKLIASIQLHPDTFQPRNGTQTSVLFLQKKTEKEMEQELQQGKVADYSIFFGMADKVGHDKRGVPTYKRDKEGNEILVPEEDIPELDVNAKENVTVRNVTKKRVLDDQTPAVAEIFLKWKEKQGIRW